MVTIDSTKANTFTQQQWDEQLPATGPNGLPQASTTFLNQRTKASSDAMQVEADAAKLPGLVGDPAAYLTAFSQLGQDTHAFHQSEIQLINAAKSDGSPDELIEADDVASQARAALGTAAKSVNGGPIDAPDLNSIVQDFNDIGNAGAYQVNGQTSFDDQSFNGLALVLDNQDHTFLDPNDNTFK